ncbi:MULTISPECIES: amino acid adenylation domain-containing protein [unclassified Streptomyces]|uniref:amino acid adenylation domain-containing protein n=1 Tax=unclassified Streptomyces TaxID=2593676 RepID=UPI0035E106D9
MQVDSPQQPRSEEQFPPRTVHDLVARRAAHHPEATAVIAGERRTSYRELLALAARIGALLPTSPRGRTGICLGRDERTVAAFLGVWRAGRSCVALDPALPPSRLAHMVDAAGIGEVLTTPELAPVVAAAGARPLIVDTVPHQDVHDSPAPPPARTAGEEAYVLFTSGSTGTPKGVVIGHSSVLALMEWMTRTIDPAHLRVGLATASLSFDASIHQIFGPLCAGGSVVIADDILALPDLPARDEVTMISAPPSGLAILLERPLPPGVRRVNAGAEPVPRPLVDQLYAQPGVETVVNLYGPTECTVFCATHPIGRDETGTPPIGTAVAGCELSVRDPRQRPVPDGTAGELWVAGPLVGLGYLDSPEATAANFVTDPESPGGRRYRTGDLVRRTNGVLHYLGRLDEQIKVRGFRVEPGDIEAVLATLPGVRHAVVLAPVDRGGTRTLHAHVEAVPESAPAPTEEELLRLLRTRLPHYLVPARVLVTDRLPRSSNGKVDRKALSAVTPPAGTTEPGERPRPGAETRLAAIVGEVLGTDRPVGRTDRFDLLGGHSLAAARVLARVRTEWGAVVPLGDFLTEPTVAALAGLIDEAPPVPAPARRPDATESPLSDMQRELWTTRQISPVPGVTTEAFVLGIDGAVTTDALRAALDALVVRHEALRTVVAETPHGPVARVLPPAPVPLTEHDMTRRTAEEADALVDAAARQVFTPEDTPLLRTVLVRTAPDRARLVIAVDHLAFDGWSGSLVLDELAAALDGRPVPEPDVQLGDVARWEEHALALSSRSHRDFWHEELKGALPPWDLARRPRAGTPAHRGARLVRRLPPGTAEAVRDLAASSGVSEFAVYLAALDVLVAHWTGRHDVLVAVPVARRPVPELDRVVGPLLFVPPVRVGFRPEETFRTVAARAALARNRALAHTMLPAAALAEAATAAGLPRRPGAPLTPVSLSMRPSGAPVRVDAGPVTLRVLGERDTGSARDDATFLVNTTVSGTEIHLVHDLECFDERAAGALLDGLLHVLARGTAAPDRSCSAIDLPLPPPPAELTEHPTELPDSSGELPGPDGSRRTAPSTVVEEFLATVWEQLLPVEDVSASDSFLDLGGTSLTAMRVAAEIWDALGVDVPVRTVFALPVLRDLAAEVERQALAALDAAGPDRKEGTA